MFIQLPSILKNKMFHEMQINIYHLKENFILNQIIKKKLKKSTYKIQKQN